MSETQLTESFGERVIKLGTELALLEEKLLSPDHKPEDIVRHIQLVKELRRLTL